VGLTTLDIHREDQPMSWWNRRRPARMLRASHVLVVPGGVTPAEVEGYVRQWTPDTLRVADTVLRFDGWYELRGPVEYDESVWREAGLPAEYRQAYAIIDPAGGTRRHPDSSVLHAVIGLARRLGQWRAEFGQPWENPADEPPDPSVCTARRLSADELLDLLAPYVPGLTLVPPEENDEWADLGYMLESAEEMVESDFEFSSRHPRVRDEPWFTSPDDVAEYRFVSESAAARDRVVTAAKALAAATDGVVLDQNGFPWAG
jgi:hypothetical protein